MSHDFHDDPRLTAYALGELPPGECAAIEALLARDAAARAFVEETRAFASVLSTEMGADAVALDDTARDAIRARAAAGARPRGKVLRVAQWAVPASLSAAILASAVAVGQRSDAWTNAPVTTVGWGPSSNAQFAATPALEPVRFVPSGDSQDGSWNGITAAGSAPRPAPAAAVGIPGAASATLGSDFSAGVTAGGGGAGGPGGGAGGATPSGGAGGAYYVRTEEARAGVNGGGSGSNLKSPSPGATRLPPERAGEWTKRLADVEKKSKEGGAPAGGKPASGRLHKAFLPGDTREAHDRGFRGQDVNLDPTGELTEVRDELTSAQQAAVVADFDTEIAQAAAIGDPFAQRAALAVLVRNVETTRGAEGAAIVFDAALRRIGERARFVDGSPESYSMLDDNPFRTSLDSPLSTFGIDVDTASYANVRRFLRQGQLPPVGAVRVEEMLNYFPYRYDAPADGSAFAVHTEVAGCPWDTTHRLVRIGIKGREADLRDRPAANLVFLVDVSGSMQPANKLPLLVQSMKQMVPLLDARDTVSVVVYAGAAGCALEPTRGDRHADIEAALDRLQAGGSTNGGAGIELAYKLAAEHFVAGGINRVVLATDGDFNVGTSDESSLARLIEEKAKTKVFLTVLGFGEGNLQDSKMEALADRGNGNYAYVDSLREGHKVLVEQAAGTLMTLAKDVKLQVEFNPLRVASYRLIGYENRVLATEDFANDRKDAGDLGAGHTVTALYEIVPAAQTVSAPSEPLRYQTGAAPTDAAKSGELMTVKLRWKLPEGDVSTLREFTAQDSTAGFDQASPDFHFQAAVAAFGMLLRGSPHRGTSNLGMVEELAQSGLAFDPNGHRAEFVDLVRAAKAIVK